MVIVQHAHEARFAALGGGVAVAVAVTGGHHQHRRLGDEGFDRLRQVGSHLRLNALDGPAEGLGKAVVERRLQGPLLPRLVSMPRFTIPRWSTAWKPFYSHP